MSDIVCCPLSEGDEAYKVYNVTVRRAAKVHHCTECGEDISKGDKYEHARGLFDGSWDTHKTCLSCVEIRKHFSCGRGAVPERLWERPRGELLPRHEGRRAVHGRAVTGREGAAVRPPDEVAAAEQGGQR